MKIAIIVAMEKELRLLLPLINDCRKVSLKDYCGYEGKMGNHDVTVMQCGIGKVNSALTTYALIESAKPELVINTGVAGGADKNMHVLDVLVATEVAYHDVWCGPGTVYGAAAGCEVFLSPDKSIVELSRKNIHNPKVKYGLICSGDKFISLASEVDEIKHHFPQALAVDMESASIAQVCTMKNIPFNIIRVISDTPGEEENISQYENFWTDAPAETFRLLRELLSLL